MSEEEKIRRAEQISARRNNRIPANEINSKGKRQTTFLAKLSLQILTSICIFGLCYFLTQNHSYAIDIIKPVISSDTDFQKLYSDLNYAIKNITNTSEKQENAKDESQTTEVNENNSNTDTTNQPQQQEQNNTEQGGIGGGDDNIQTSETEDDITFIKNHASFIKPLEGTITSLYGERTATDIISGNHAGIDIGADIGTEIIASMEGEVELASSEGDYGNHLKISNGEISTLYAHCSKLLVNQGEHITQGQKIAEVGSTGKATGPHLHFEIRRNDKTVNPQQILQLD